VSGGVMVVLLPQADSSAARVKAIGIRWVTVVSPVGAWSFDVITRAGRPAGVSGRTGRDDNLSTASLLFGLRANDPVTFAAAAAVLSLTAGAAALLPALRAARVDPMTALRQE